MDEQEKKSGWENVGILHLRGDLADLEVLEREIAADLERKETTDSHSWQQRFGNQLNATMGMIQLSIQEAHFAEEDAKDLKTAIDAVLKVTNNLRVESAEAKEELLRLVDALAMVIRHKVEV